MAVLGLTLGGVLIILLIVLVILALLGAARRW